MFAVIGLGNPGSKYERTRHNAGFWVLDELARRLAAGESWRTRDGCLFIRTRLQQHELLLVKPQKYMNLSGQALRPLLEFYKIPPEQCVVIYDELDLPAGRIQVRRGGSAAGHNGIKDILQHLSSSEFYRIRVGIAPHSAQGAGGKSWVLSVPGPEEQELLEKAVTLSADALETLIEEGLEKAQQGFNRKTA